MANRTLRVNRRREVRHYCFGTVLGWRRENSGYKRRKGWLNDISASGVSFLAEPQRQPTIGEDVELYHKPSDKHGVYHVVRVQPMNGGLVLVACRKDPAPGAATMPDPGPELTQRAAPAKPAAVHTQAA